MSKLYIVGTPIGNIKDITLRALDTLKEVDVIACEDTRVTSKLLAHYNIKKRLISYHDYNEKQSAKGIIELIENDQSVAIVSDAGMPVVNDPGFEVIRQAIEKKIQIEVIPGVSAVLTTLALSNFDTHFKFLGFLKPKTIQRQNQLQKLESGTYIIFASPHKIKNVLNDMETVFGESLLIFIGRELTKKFESHYRGPIAKVKNKIKDEIKGEFTIAISVPKKGKVNKYDK